MDFRLSQEQQQFSDSLRRWTEKDYTFEKRKTIVYSDTGVSSAAWQALANLGSTALPVPEEQGGLNGSAVDMMIVMKELGRGLVVEPYFATMLGTEFLKKTGGHEILEKVASGDAKLACALSERESGHELFNIGMTAKANGGGYVLNGEKTVVIHGAQADGLIVSARTSGEQRDKKGISLFFVPTGTQGVSCCDYRTFDGQRAADITFANVQLASSALLGQVDLGWDVLDEVSDYGVVLLCSEAVGAMEAANSATLEYLKTREQFGVPIGTFQVLQHRMADMYIHLEQSRSITTLAVVRVSSTDAQERRQKVSAAKARVGQAMKYIGQQAVQMHGGMGMSNELPISHYFKRMTAIELTLGNTDHHLARFIEQPGFTEDV